MYSFLKESLDPDSYFKPYLDFLPPPGSILNICTISPDIVKLLGSQHWVRHSKLEGACGVIVLAWPIPQPFTSSAGG
jgi:hypothetical protein